MGMVFEGYRILKTYNLDVSSSVDKKTVHPYKEWTRVGVATAAPSAFYLIFWGFNLAAGNNGNWIHRLTNFLGSLLRFNALVIVYFILMASGSYGTSAEVALGTDWAMEINDDSNYTSTFNQAMLIQILNLVFSFTAFDGMKKYYKYQVKQREEEKKLAEKQKNRRILDGNCPQDMKEIDNYCYFGEDKQWDWDF